MSATDKKVRIVGDKWPPQSNTYVQLDCTKTLKDSLDDLATKLEVEKTVLEKESVFCRAADGGKMGAPIKPDEVLDMVAAKPILFIRKRPAGGTSPVAKPGAKIAAKPGTKVPPPPPGAKTSSPKVAPGGAGGVPKSPMKSKLPPGKTKAIPVGPPGAKKTVPAAKPGAKPAAKPAAATAAATPKEEDKTPTDSTPATPANEEKKNDDDDFDPTSKMGGTAFGNNNSKPPPDDSDDESNSGGAATTSKMPDDSADDEKKNDDEPAQEESAPPAVVEKPAPAVGGKKVFAKKASTTPPPETAAAASKPASSATTATASSSGGGANNAILATSGNSSGMDNVAATLAAQRSVDERLLQLQKSLIDEEKKRLETYENNLRHALAAEVDTIRQQLNSSMSEERARSMQVQAVLEEQRTQLLKALAARDGQLQLAQGALQEAVTLGGKQAGPALRAISGGGDGAASSSASASQLAKDVQAQNDNLKRLLESQKSDSKASKNANRAELDAMIKAQTKLIDQVDHLKSSNAPPPNAVEEQKKDLATFLTSVGLSRFIEVLTKQDIDIEILGSMNDDELQKAGVDTVGARKRILLEFMKNNKRGGGGANNNLHLQSSLGNPGLQSSSSGESARQLFANAGSPMGNSKKSVVFGENQVTLIPSTSGQSQQSSPTSRSVSGGGQARQDAQQASIQAAQLTPALQDHHRILHQLFRRAGASDWLSRSAEMVDSFKDSLPALYEAVSSKLGVPAPNFQSGTGAFALKQFISRRFPHLISAIDVMVFLADGREAEFADTMMLRQLKIGPQRLVWFSVPVPPSKAPEFADDTSGGKEKLYYYSALSKMSQWKRPTLFQDTTKPVPKVVIPNKPLDDGIPSPGDKLGGNPNPAQVEGIRATDQQFIAATLSLLMRKDPSKLTQFPDFCRAYERKSADGQTEGKINYKGMYLDALQAYGPDDD